MSDCDEPMSASNYQNREGIGNTLLIYSNLSESFSLLTKLRLCVFVPASLELSNEIRVRNYSYSSIFVQAHSIHQSKCSSVPLSSANGAISAVLNAKFNGHWRHQGVALLTLFSPEHSCPPRWHATDLLLQSYGALSSAFPPFYGF
jgi:hypothetical protein